MVTSIEKEVKPLKQNGDTKMKTQFNFTLETNRYTADWNPHMKCVVVQSSDVNQGGFNIYEDSIEPRFNWKYTTDHLVNVAYFLESTNMFDTVKALYDNDPSNRTNRMIVRKAQQFDEIKESSEVA